MANYRVSVIEKILECPICIETFVKPKMLPCQHSFCLKCIYHVYVENKSLSELNQLTCPICRTVYDLQPPTNDQLNDLDYMDKLLQNHFVLAGLLDMKQKPKEPEVKQGSESQKETSSCRCNVCGVTELKWHCITCDKGFCDNCVPQHFEEPEHEVVDLEIQAVCEYQYSTQTIDINDDSDVFEEDNVNNNFISNRKCWDNWLKIMVQPNQSISECVIADSSGTTYAQYHNSETPQVHCTERELNRFNDYFNDIMETLSIGIRLGTKKYHVVFIDNNLVFAKNTVDGLFLLKSQTFIVLLLFKDINIGTSPKAREIIKQIETCLIQQGY